MVNNAGFANLHGVEWGPAGVELYQKCLDINTLGVIRVTRAFLPLLKRTNQSRILFVTSVEDKQETLCQPAYCISKFGARAFANCLRRELRLRNHLSELYVSVIEPAFFSTPMTTTESLLTALENNWKSTPASVKESWGGSSDNNSYYYDTFVNFTQASFLIQHQDISPVINTMVDVITRNCEPKFFYRICGPTESFLFWLTDIIPDEWIDILNTPYLMISSFKILKYITNGPLHL